jgi:putative ABC transport system substrate-binding protein
MKRLYIPFILSAAVAALGAGSSQQTKTYRSDIVIDGQTNRIQPQLVGLRDGLEELKYIEGKNLVINITKGDNRDQLHDALIAQLQRFKPDVIVALGTFETTVAKQASQNLPIVFLPAADPLRSGFVKSLANPGGNLTGLAFYSGPESLAKQFEVFTETVPHIRRMLTLFDNRDGLWGTTTEASRLRVVAKRLGTELIEVPLTSTKQATQKIAALSPKEFGTVGIFIVCSGLFRELAELSALAIRNRLPLFGCNSFQVAEQRVLVSYAPDLYSMGYRGAWYLDRIFHGVKPEQLPVETPIKFDFVINQKTAAEIGLELPHKTLIFADRVFQ